MEYPDWGSSSHGRDGWTPAGTWSAVGPPEDDPGDWLRPTGHGRFERASDAPEYGQPWVPPRPQPAQRRGPWEELNRRGPSAPREQFGPREAPASGDPRARQRPGQARGGGWYEHSPPAPRRGGSSPERRPGRDPTDQLDEDDEPSGRGYVAALFATAAWYLAPVALYLLWTLTLGSAQDASCIETSGAPCIAPRSEALATLVDSAPQLGTALALSLTLALTLRWMTSMWRTVAVGFAAAVVGAGVTTVVFSLFT